MKKSIYPQLMTLLDDRIDCVLVTVVEMTGSSPQEPGAKMLVTAERSDKPRHGTVGGGQLEWFALQQASELLADQEVPDTRLVTLNLQSDLGMTCGGRVQLFFERHLATGWEIAVLGAGHVAQALIPLLLTLECRVHCFDDRSHWLDQLTDHPSLHKHLLSDWEQPVSGLTSGCYVISVTQGHCQDLQILSRLLQDQQPPYVGIIGSDSKAVRMRKQLLEAGVSEAIVTAIHCPIGLPVGLDTPTEIAISIAAQLLQIRDQNG
jgi:xanthine dehydrogenase accessory factor